MAPLSAGRGRSTLPRTRLMGNSGSHQPQSASAFQFPLFSPCCTSLLARLEFPVQEILRPQPGHVPESNCHRGVCPAREQSGVANEIQNDWIGGLMFALGASLSIVPGVAREKNPERKCLFRGNHPPSYQMVSGCTDLRQLHHRAGRCIQVPKSLSLWGATRACASPAWDHSRASH
jgi:hypothetical protein